MMRLAIVIAFALGASSPAAAERMVASLSTHRVMITSSFTGLELVLFGSVEPDRASVPRRGAYDLVATVTGPRERTVTRRKERVLGLWVNIESRTFIDVPSYLAVLSSRPHDAIADADTIRRLRIGLAQTVLPQQIGADIADVVRDDPFRTAFLRLKARHRLYSESPGGVTFLTPTLFRAPIYLPAVVQIGTYEVDLKLFADGAMIARTNSAFEVIKVGFEQFVANSARHHGILYGLATAAMALMTGWFASIVFRRD